jgi:hypothetical protein
MVKYAQKDVAWTYKFLIRPALQIRCRIRKFRRDWSIESWMLFVMLFSQYNNKPVAYLMKM